MSNDQQVAVFNSFRKDLSAYEKNVVSLLDDAGITPEKFIVTVENMVRRNPALLNCDRKSLFASILTAAEFGLEPNTPAGLSWIIPYRNNKTGITNAEWQIGYQGVSELLYRNKRVKKVMAELVFTNDLFKRWMGDDMNWHFTFEPAEDGKRGARKGVFAIIHIEGEEPIYSYLSSKEIEDIKMKSKKPETYNENNDPQGWMWKKAAVKQAAKLAPKNGGKVTNALNIDGMVEAGATLIVDETGKVIVSKHENSSIPKNKLNIVFGTADTEYEVVN